MKCYYFKEFKYKFGLFDKSIDCSYIIHLEGNNKRLLNIKNQLNKYKPTKNIIIYFNKGFKKCKKKLYKQQTNYDIIDSYIKIFKHAKSKNFKNIFIFEDDFILDRLILQEDINNINNFCNNNIHKKFTLSLGIIPIIYYPENKYINKSIIGPTTHNYIYSWKIRNFLLKNVKEINKCGDFDIYLNQIFIKYFYYKPLIFQRFEETENQKNWYNLFGIKLIALKYFKFLEFEKNPKKAFKNHYKLAYISNVMLVLLIILSILIIVYYIRLYYLTD